MVLESEIHILFLMLLKNGFKFRFPVVLKNRFEFIFRFLVIWHPFLLALEGLETTYMFRRE